MTLWNKLKTFKLFIQLVRDPNRTDLIFQGVEIASSDPDQALVQEIENYVLMNPEFRAMFEDKYNPDLPSLTDLKSYPESSFGHAVYNHMKSNGLDFSLWPKTNSQRPIQYLSSRIYHDHDLWHALLGYGITVEDELALQAFGVAQFRSPIALMLVAGGLIHLIGKDPSRAMTAFQKINKAYDLGQRAPFLLSYRLNTYFPLPLVDVRKLVGLKTDNV